MKTSWLNEIQEFMTTYPDAPYILAGVVALIFVLWLILRSVKLWYWKINDRKETLEHINDTLEEIRDEICSKSERTDSMGSGKSEKENNACGVKGESINDMPAVTPPHPTVLVQSDNATVVVQQPQPPEPPMPRMSEGQFGGNPVSMPSRAMAGAEDIGRDSAIAKAEAKYDEQPYMQPELNTILHTAEQDRLESPEGIEGAEDKGYGIFKYMTRDCNRDKMGRVYTREEIEANIKA